MEHWLKRSQVQPATVPSYTSVCHIAIRATFQLLTANFLPTTTLTRRFSPRSSPQFKTCLCLLLGSQSQDLHFVHSPTFPPKPRAWLSRLLLEPCSNHRSQSSQLNPYGMDVLEKCLGIRLAAKCWIEQTDWLQLIEGTSMAAGIKRLDAGAEERACFVVLLALSVV